MKKSRLWKEKLNDRKSGYFCNHSGRIERLRNKTSAGRSPRKEQGSTRLGASGSLIMDPDEASEREKALKTGINHYLRRLTNLSPLEQLEQIKGDLQFHESREIVQKR